MAQICKDSLGNCTKGSDDSLPVQCVGEWALQKHDILKRYVEASSGPRGVFLRSGLGAAFIDLFAGPGRARVRETGAFIPGSSLIALDHEREPFTRVISCDKAPANAAALRARTTASANRMLVLEGDCNHQIREAVKHIPRRGLNMALLDPYGLRPLHFETIAELAEFERMDLIIHFPVMDLKRNYGVENYRGYTEKFLGTADWGFDVTGPSDVVKLLDVLRRQLGQFKYSQEHVRSQVIRNSTKAPIYYLVYAAKHDKGSKIWNSIIKTTPTGQTSFGFKS